ncbi:MMPL family transporter [Halomicrobium sp. IBSBa]|uniref:efflux RND transporter permease subunit n=1 Tax=Halomicrobium sp. IBSBa TaxID=2778916 RepID=UPI001ABFAF48|nr:MMPL family transporter [Halomicrobium sp. IBSBa]MBO4249107.1 MMPL family transporter [Halomicrobium sp. IBSBa]
MEYQRYIDWIDDKIIYDSRRVILAFLVLTLVFGAGLSNISTSAGTSQFATGLEEEQALEDINREFSPTFETDTGSTQLIQKENNVLSKPAMLRMLEAQKRVQDHPDMRVTSTSSAAAIVAQTLDPSATTLDQQIDAIERAPASEIDRAVRRADESSPQFRSIVSQDFNRGDASASASIGVISHEVPAGLSSGSGQGGSSPLTAIQKQAEFQVDSAAGGSITVFGSGIVADEFGSVITDSLLIVVPAAVIFIFLFLSIAYRDPVDLALGLFALLLAIVWTFGFTGIANIPFSQLLIAVPPLLLAVGIDFGIHAINRYREELVLDRGVDESMRTTTDQLLVAFFIVTGTTVIGFLANFTSALQPIREFGVVAGVGIVFTFLIFGIFLPAAKVEIDRLRERYPIPTLSETPLGSEDSALGSVLRVGVTIGDAAPALVLIVLLVGSAGAGVYAQDIDTTFSQEDFLPPEDTPAFLEELPEPFAPGEYTVSAQLNYLEDKFATTQSSETTVYVEGPMQRDTALEEIYRAGDDPPSSFAESDGRAESTSIVTVIQSYAQQDPEFRRLVDRNDQNDNGVPDQNLELIYDELFASPAGDRAENYMTEERRSARVVYTVEADAEQSEITEDTRTVADRFRMTATATGNTVVFKAVSDLILESAITSLAVALIGSAIFLMLIYRVFEGYATLGIVNVLPVAVTVTMVAASMRFLAIPFNAITATILAITIGLGVDYSVHVTHRFADERAEHDLRTALDRTVRGTGGALLGSMLTTVSGIGVLALALFPALGQFGVLTGLSITFAFLASLLVLPPALVLWDALINEDRRLLSLFGIGPKQKPTTQAPTVGGEPDE